MKDRLTVGVLLLCCWVRPVLAERINQEGRILGAFPVVTNAILFNTNLADAVVSAMQIFPVTSAWNEDVSRRPVLSNSDAMIGQIMTDLTNRQTLRAFTEMNFVLVPTNQPFVPIDFTDYPDESDPSPYPIPTNMPVEEWPAGTGSQTLQQWQQNDDGSDRHSIVVQPGTGYIWETWRTVLNGTNWTAANGAKFNLNSNVLRPDGWTSGDAAGLPMFPALVRFDECERGMVEHACRIVVKRSKYNSHIYPATHYAAPSSNTSVNLPSMGQRVRLKASYPIPATWSKEAQAVLKGMKKYGAIVADNGGFFSISVTPDNRWPSGCFDSLSTVSITNFEVVVSTGANEGPRSPGAPAADAGPDSSAMPGVPLQLSGVVISNTAPTTNLWKLYTGPGSVTWGDASQTNTTATFSAPGTYTLLLSADDGVHAVAYDAIVVTVGQALTLTIAQTESNLNLSWSGGSPPYVVESADTLPASGWSGVLTTSQQSASVPISSGSAFFRIRGN